MRSRQRGTSSNRQQIARAPRELARGDVEKSEVGSKDSCKPTWTADGKALFSNTSWEYFKCKDPQIQWFATELNCSGLCDSLKAVGWLLSINHAGSSDGSLHHSTAHASMHHAYAVIPVPPTNGLWRSYSTGPYSVHNVKLQRSRRFYPVFLARDRVWPIKNSLTKDR